MRFTFTTILTALILAIGLGIGISRPVSADGCTVTSAKFSNFWSTETGSYGGQTQGFFLDSSHPVVTLGISTSGCAGQKVYVTLVEDTGISDEIPELNDKSFNVPANENFTITLSSGETYCTTNPAGEDCRYYLYAGPESDHQQFYSKNQTQGVLRYECDGSNIASDILTNAASYANPFSYGNTSIPVICGESWHFIGDTADHPENSTTLIDNGSIDPLSACYDATTGKMKDGCYEVFGGLADAMQGKFKVINDAEGVGGFFNGLFALIVGVAGIITFIIFVYWGYKYFTSDESGDEATLSKAKGRMVTTGIGFLLLLSIPVILLTLNPDLLNLTPRIQSVNFETGGDPTFVSPTDQAQQNVSISTFASTHNITCPGSGGAEVIPTITNSMTSKITYSMLLRGKLCSGDTMCLDCSGFVNAVYSCAGIPSPGYTTLSIFAVAEPVVSLSSTSVNGIPLKTGDLLGWKAGDLVDTKPEKFGHVVMYIGNGLTIESTSGSGGKEPGKAVQVRPANAYGKRIKYVKRL